MREYRWWLIGGLWLGALVLGYSGFARYYASQPDQPGPGWPSLLYLALQLFILEAGWVAGPANWQVEVARLLAPAVAAYTALEGLALVFSEQFLMLRLGVSAGHVVVCGLGPEGSRLARALRDQGYYVVAVDNDPGAPAAERCREEGIAVVVGDPTQRDTLGRVGAGRAKYLIAACGDDSANAEVALRARSLCEGRQRGALTCFVSMSDLDVCQLLREKVLGADQVPGFRLEFSSLYERAARAMVDAYGPFSAGTEEGKGTPDVLVVGLGRLGEALLVRDAWEWHCRAKGPDARLRVTVVDRQATARCEALLVKYPQLGQAVDLVACDLDVTSPEFGRGAFLARQDGRCSLAVAYVCLPEDALSLAAALALHRSCRRLSVSFSIVVGMMEESGLAELLSAGDRAGTAFSNVHAFAFLDEACQPDIVVWGVNEVLAEATHEHYLSEALAGGEAMGSRPALHAWAELSEDLKESNRERAAHASEQLGNCGYHVVPLTDWDAENFQFPEDDVERLARLEHERWCRERRKAGWKLGPSRDYVRRTHPSLVEWDDLPEDTKEWNRRMVRSLPRLLPRVGFQIARVREL